MKKFALLLGLIAAMFAAGCTVEVPQGTKCKVMTVDGWQDEIYDPGRATCWNRDVAYFIDTTEDLYTEPLQILCADELNFKFNVNTRCGVNDDKEALNRVFAKVRAGEGNLITRQQIYSIYVKPVVEAEARKIVAARETSQINAERGQIENEIRTAVLAQLKTVPVNIGLINVSNLDFPLIITEANEKNKQREIAIKEERAKAQIAQARAEGELRVKNKEYQIALLEAKEIADAQAIIGASLNNNPLYLAWQQNKVLLAAAKSQNKLFIVPFDMMNGGGTSGLINSALVRDAVQSNGSPDATGALKRAQDAQKAANDAEQRFNDGK